MSVNQKDFRSTHQRLAHSKRLVHSRDLFIAAVFTLSQGQKRCRCSSTEEGCLSSVSIARRHQDQKQLGEEGFISVSHHGPSSKKVRAGSLESGSGSCGRTLLTGLLLIACPILLPYTLQTTCPGVATPTVCWLGLPVTIINQDTPQRLAHRPVLWRDFLNRGSLFSDDPSLSQIKNIKNNNNNNNKN